MELNKQARGGTGDPYYGAPTIVLVLADPERGTCVEDASCVLCTMMDAAHAIGLASCWIHGEKEMFQLPEGKALLKEWRPAGKPAGRGFPGLGLRCRPPAPAQRAAKPTTSTRCKGTAGQFPRQLYGKRFLKKGTAFFVFLPESGFSCVFPLEKL